MIAYRVVIRMVSAEPYQYSDIVFLDGNLVRTPLPTTEVFNASPTSQEGYHADSLEQYKALKCEKMRGKRYTKRGHDAMMRRDKLVMEGNSVLLGICYRSAFAKGNPNRSGLE
jgi:hypothetical protein